MTSTFVVAALPSASVPSPDVLLGPALVEVAPDRLHADVTLTNAGTEPRESLAEALAWTQDDAGQVTLWETDAVECADTDRCEVILTNTGNVQMRPDRVTVVIGSVQGALAERELDAWWILPGATRRYPIALERFLAPREVLVRVTRGAVERTASAIVVGVDEEPLALEAVDDGELTASAGERP